MSRHLKIFVFGPTEAGKSAISNHLAELSDSLGKEYRPTKALRILEFDRKLVDANYALELYDTSGAKELEGKYAPLLADADGFVFVLNSDQQEEVLAKTYSLISGIKESQCLILMRSQPTKKFSKPFSKIKTICFSVDNLDALKPEFDQFFVAAYKTAASKSEAQERSILAQ